MAAINISFHFQFCIIIIRNSSVLRSNSVQHISSSGGKHITPANLFKHDFGKNVVYFFQLMSTKKVWYSVYMGCTSRMYVRFVICLHFGMEGLHIYSV